MTTVIAVLVTATIVLLTAAATWDPGRRRRRGAGVRLAAVKHLAARAQDPAAARLLESSDNPRGWTVEQLAHQQLVTATITGTGAAGGGLLLAVAAGAPALGVIAAPVLAAGGAALGWGSPLRTLRALVADRVAAVTLVMPGLLVTIAAALRSGSTVVAAVQEGARELPTGTARDELDRVQAQLTLGTSFVEAMQEWRDRVPCPLVDEAAQKLVDSLRTGVNAAESLAALAAKATHEAAALRRTRIQKVKLQIMAATIMCLAPAAGLFMIYPIGAQTLAQLNGAGGGP